MSGNDDQQVATYLGRLAAAASGLPDDRRDELLGEISAHITEARARAADDPDGVRRILDQLGDPADIVAAAGPRQPSHQPRPSSRRAGVFEIIAVLFLLIGGIVIPLVGWVVGVVMLWTSDRWKTRDKVLGTVIWPGGLLAALVPLAVLTIPVTVLPCSGGAVVSRSSANGSVHSQTLRTTCASTPGMPQWLALAIFGVALLASIAGPIVIAIRLLSQARQAAVPAEHDDSEAVYAPA